MQSPKLWRVRLRQIFILTHSNLPAVVILVPPMHITDSFEAPITMPRRRRKRANWPYRLAWLAIIGTIALYIAVQTLVTGLTDGRRSYGIDWRLAFVASCLDAVFATWFVAVGSSIGSFLNVVAFRLPLGRHVGGHSGCFYCQTPIRSTDNVPVLAWIKLRGRCRTCRLPISIQYPLVELCVGLVFLCVYVMEISSSGSNLPSSGNYANSGSLLRMNLTSELITRALTFLAVTSGLIAAALIAVRRQAVPLKLFAWSLTPWAIALLLRPDLVIVRWRSAEILGNVDARLDAFTTMLCGIGTAIAVARVIAPILYPGFDRTLISSDRSTQQTRQLLAGMAVAGATVGWQAVVPMAWVLLGSSLVAVLVLRRFRAVAELGDLVVWLWLGLLLFRANWRWLSQVQLLPEAIPSVVQLTIAALLLAPAAMLFRRLARPPESDQFEVAEAEAEENDSTNFADDE
jgi:leader peptidase (prepilin peptidase) / N-methyltransferase